MTEESLFAAALERTDPADRAAFLRDACAGDGALLRRVEALLAASEDTGEFLSTPAPDLEILTTDADGGTTPHPLALPTTSSSDSPIRPITEGPGTVIGPYTLKEKIGEGGMGVVYLAEQAVPVRRTVALKVIKPGMDTDQVVSRFEAERQALAMMDHPSIARVLDAGATASGRPYFVMEHVLGEPITAYCDRHRLTPSRRLELLIPVCQAVQHAHQKGIIHRDLKPSNVLVTLVDGQPVPKVIDFGIAKAIDQPLTDRTLTQHGVVVGTPEYMSPEQAGASPDIDTRTDVYALGVILYELLTGSTPLQRESLRVAGLLEILRRVRDEDPPRPSTRLSDSGDRLPSISAVRGIEPSRLPRLVRGDLDWIVMKAIDKDRARRYDSPSAFALDIRRHLDGDPVSAGPPSRTYRLGKFARKHRVALATASAFAALLIAATALSIYLAVRATAAEALAERRFRDLSSADAATTRALAVATVARARSDEDRARAEAVSGFLVDAFHKPDPAQDGRDVKVVDLLDDAARGLAAEAGGAPRTRISLLGALGETYLGLGLYDRARETAESARVLGESSFGPGAPEALVGLNLLARVDRAVGRFPEAIRRHEAILDAREAGLGPGNVETLAARNHLVEANHEAGRFAEAARLGSATLKDAEAALGPDHFETRAARKNLAIAEMGLGHFDEAARLASEAASAAAKAKGADDRETLYYRDVLANVHRAAGRTPEAIRLYEATLRAREARFGGDHPFASASRNLLATIYYDAGRFGDAARLGEANLKARAARLGPEHPETLQTRNNLAAAYMAEKRLPEAILHLEAILKAIEAKVGPNAPDALGFRNNLANAYVAVGRLGEAVALHEANLRGCEATFGPDDPNTARSRANLGRTLRQAGRADDSVALLRADLARLESGQGAEAPASRKARAALAQQLQDLDRFGPAQALWGPLIERRRVAADASPADRAEFAGHLASSGACLVRLGRWAEAEPLLREATETLASARPDSWIIFYARGLLGDALLGQGRFAEAEAPIVDAYRGLKARAGGIPPIFRPRLAEAGDRVVRLYEIWGKAATAAAWRTMVHPPAILPDDVFAH